ncbi:MAG TPA: DHH family phosphoesterase [Lachnospiraceae bacterium]|nr:DHH family phosphoesterase [Lachnospiraceae bacterium]
MKIEQMLEGAATLAIAGHVHPDGDCVGSCMGLYLYLKKNMPGLAVDIYLEEPQDIFSYIKDIDQAQTVCDPKKVYDVFLTLDASSVERIGVAGCCLENAGKTICIDHHFTNPGIGMVNVIDADASSSCEVLYGLLDDGKIDKAIAEALYTGMIHDTGVFQYANTRPQTMKIAASLIEKGINFSRIIEQSFYEKTYGQERILGRVLERSGLYLDDQVIVGVARKEDLDEFRVTAKDMDGIVSQLRLTRGIQAAIFLYPAPEDSYKVSLRAKGDVDVSAVAGVFGGGGHIRAAGCTVKGTVEEVTTLLLDEMKKRL